MSEPKTPAPLQSDCTVIGVPEGCEEGWQSEIQTDPAPPMFSPEVESTFKELGELFDLIDPSGA